MNTEKLNCNPVAAAAIHSIDFINHKDTLFLCIITLKNGAMVVGKSTHQISVPYQVSIGDRLVSRDEYCAFEDAVDQVCQLEAYVMASQAMQAAQAAVAAS